ncbi:MAG TPA: hypothetical protein VFE45_02950 [Coriobacteriia bacterium]|nr:hypothetical protein [Coriobacteriia bacterium]
MEDAHAWALHVNGRDGEALAHERQVMLLGTRNALFFFRKQAHQRLRKVQVR